MRIALVTTGGTIATKALCPSGEAQIALSAGDMLGSLGSGLAVESIAPVDYSNLPSSHFDGEYARGLADEVQRLLEEVDAVVITHGTDTMEETAFYLEMVLPKGPPVVLTGSMVSAGLPGYDGPANLRDALLVASDPRSRNRGVMVVMHQDVLSAVDVTKRESQRQVAFGGRNTGKMGAVCGGRVLYYMHPPDHPRLRNEVAGRVCLLKMHYDIHADLVEQACRVSDAVVLECYGSGRVPPRVLKVMRGHTGTIFVATPRPYHGHLHDTYLYEGGFRDLVEMGVIISPLDSLKSCVLVRLCMGNGLRHGETKALFEGFFQFKP